MTKAGRDVKAVNAHPTSSRTQVSDPLDALARGLLSKAEGGSRVIVGIVGPPGSGKTHFANWLTRRLDDLRGRAIAVHVPMDGFHLANDVLINNGLRSRKGAPGTFDVSGFIVLLKRLVARDEPVVYAPAFRRDLEEPIAGAIPVPRESVFIIVEGNYLLLEDGAWADVRGYLDEVWYLDTPEETCRERLFRRHATAYGSIEASRAWVDSVDDPNAAIVRQSREKADRILDVATTSLEGDP